MAGSLTPVRALRGWRAAPGAIQLELEVGRSGGTAQLAIARDGSVRLRAACGRALPPDAGDALGREPWRASNAEPFPLESEGVALAFDGAEGGARVEVEPRPFAIRVLGHDGRELARWHELALAEQGAARVVQGVSPGERFLGLGEHTGPLERRGRRYRLRNRDVGVREGADPLYTSIPFLLRLASHDDGTRAVGLLLDAIAPARIDVAGERADALVLETDARGLDLTLFPGPRPADALRRFTARVGRGARPPLWALGHHQSRWGYRSARSVRALARELRERGIPTDAIHLDIDYMDGYRVFTWHPKRFPDPKRLLDELLAQGLRAVPIVDPGVKVDDAYAVFQEGQARDYFLREHGGPHPRLLVWPKRAVLPDFARPEVRSWWGERHGPLLEAGAAGIWNDMNEPAGWSRELRAGRLIVPLRAQDLSRTECADPADPADAARHVPFETVRNAYGQLECRATHEALARQRPGQRPFLLTRSGTAGIQRWAAVWTGDSLSTWAQLRLSLRMLLGLSVSGVVFCGADIGGFAGRCSRELFARWMQIGALQPFARTHSMWLGPRQEPWRFGRRVEAIARRALELRMRLLPYLYGLFCEAEASGLPVWRPLALEFPDDPACDEVDDQVMLGPDLLLAPVVERGARERAVQLPPGVWYALDDDARYVGPRRVRVAAPLERLPAFARGGSVIPTRSATRHTGETPAEPAVLEVFPGGDCLREWIEDDGETTAYREGAAARTPLRLRARAGGRLRLEIGTREGEFPLAPRAFRARVHGCPEPTRVQLDALPLTSAPREDGASCHWEAGVLDARWRDDGRSRALEIEPAP